MPGPCPLTLGITGLSAHPMNPGIGSNLILKSTKKLEINNGLMFFAEFRIFSTNSKISHDILQTISRSWILIFILFHRYSEGSEVIVVLTSSVLRFHCEIFYSSFFTVPPTLSTVLVLVSPKPPNSVTVHSQLRVGH